MSEEQEDTGEIPKTVRRLLEDKGTGVSTISPNAPVREAARVMADERIGVLVCCDDPTVVAGVISERDIVRIVAVHGAELTDLTIRQVMTSDVRSCRMDDEVSVAMAMMRKGNFRHLPVVDDGRLRGLISASDILMFYMKYASLNDRRTVLDIILDSGLVYPGG